MRTSPRSSRRRLTAMLFALASVHAVAVLTSEVEPGAAQLRAGVDPTVGGMLAPGLPPGALAVAAVVALAIAALAFADRADGMAPRPASATLAGGSAFGRRRVLLGAGGAAALALAWAFRVRPGAEGDPLVLAAAADGRGASTATGVWTGASGVGGAASAGAEGPLASGIGAAPGGAGALATSGDGIVLEPPGRTSFGGAATASSAPAVGAELAAASVAGQPYAESEPYPSAATTGAPGPSGDASVAATGATASESIGAPTASMASAGAVEPASAVGGAPDVSGPAVASAASGDAYASGADLAPGRTGAALADASGGRAAASALSATGPAPSPTALAAAPTAAAASQPAPTAVAAAPRQATQTMPGGRNNYVPRAPAVKNLGTGFFVSGTVLDAATGLPVRDTRIQIWLNTARGGEALASNRGSVTTDQEGRYRLETSPVVPQFGQPHVHIAYDDGEYDTLFLRPVLKSERDASITVDFVLGSGAA